MHQEQYCQRKGDAMSSNSSRLKVHEQEQQQYQGEKSYENISAAGDESISEQQQQQYSTVEFQLQ